MENWSDNWPDGLNFVLGLWLLIAPFFGLGNAPPAAAWNSWIVGAIVVSAAAIGLTYPQRRGEWINVVGGVWIFLAPFLFGYTGIADTAWNQILVGGSIATIAAIGVARRRGPTPTEAA